MKRIEKEEMIKLAMSDLRQDPMPLSYISSRTVDMLVQYVSDNDVKQCNSDKIHYIIRCGKRRLYYNDQQYKEKVDHFNDQLKRRLLRD